MRDHPAAAARWRVRAPWLASLGLLLAAASPAAAQDEQQRVIASSVIQGRVIELGTERPVAGATLVLLGPDELPRDSAISDSTGMFALATPHTGPHRVRMHRTGYAAITTDPLVLYAVGEALEIVLRPSPEPIALAPLDVVARQSHHLGRGRDSFALHRMLGRGRFITAEEIMAKEPRTVSEALLAEDGLIPMAMPTGDIAYRPTRGWGCLRTVVNGQWGRGSPVLRLFGSGSEAYRSLGAMVDAITTPDRDGTRQRMHTVDNALRPEDIAGIEFYREANEVPREWQMAAWDPQVGSQETEAGAAGEGLDRCGLLLIWTRGAW